MSLQGNIKGEDAELGLKRCIGAATTTDGWSSILAFNMNPFTAGGMHFKPWGDARMRGTGVVTMARQSRGAPDTTGAQTTAPRQSALALDDCMVGQIVVSK